MRGKSWHWSKKNGDDEKPWDNVEELPNDPRIGKRVFCLSLLPEIETYGTILEITRYSNKNERPSHAIEHWRVLTDHRVEIITQSQYFELYEYATEFQSGDQVRRDIDGGGYWEGVILRPLAGGGQLSFLVQIKNVQTKRARSGEKEAHPPSRLTKI